MCQNYIFRLKVGTAVYRVFLIAVGILQTKKNVIILSLTVL